MKTEVKKKWLKALRSGKYEQGRGQLRFNNEFCCLGVLACVVDRDEKTWYAEDGGFGYEASQQQRLTGRLSRATVNQLIRMNDTDSKSFKAIANWIDKNVQAGRGRPRKFVKKAA